MIIVIFDSTKKKKKLQDNLLYLHLSLHVLRKALFSVYARNYIGFLGFINRTKTHCRSRSISDSQRNDRTWIVQNDLHRSI